MSTIAITKNQEILSSYTKTSSALIEKYKCKTTDDLKLAWKKEYNANLDLKLLLIEFESQKDLTIFSLKSC